MWCPRRDLNPYYPHKVCGLTVHYVYQFRHGGTGYYIAQSRQKINLAVALATDSAMLITK